MTSTYLQHQHKSSRSSSITKVFGYRKREMSSQQPQKPAPQQYIQPPAEHRRTASNNGTASGTVSSSSSHSSMNLEPAPHVAEWCHQMHMIQNRKYEWCHGCHPRIVVTPPASVGLSGNMSSEKMLQYQQRRSEPTHCYE